MTRRIRNQRGLALIVVLWIGVVLGLLAAMTLGRSNSDLRLARNVAAAAVAEAAADGAVRLAIAELAAQPYDWSDRRAIRIGSVPVAMTIENEFDRIDLNGADVWLLSALLIELGAEEDAALAMAARIADFRDEDGVTRRLGAEDADYQAAGHVTGAKDGPFESVEELARVLGVTPALEKKVVPHVTVHTGLPEPEGTSPLTASVLVRAKEMKEAAGLESQRRRIVVAQSGATTRLYRITASARSSEGGAFTRIAVVEIGPRAKNGFRVYEWARGW